MTDRQAAIDLLNATHDFPAPVIIKVIGVNLDDFAGRVLKVVRVQLNLEADPEHRIRETKAGRHLAVTTEPMFPQAEDVLALYERLREVEGVVMVM